MPSRRCSIGYAAIPCRATPGASSGGSPPASSAERRRMTSADTEAGTASRRGAGEPNWAVEIVGLHKWFGEFHVLRDVTLRVKPSERIVICGPSGSGKSTLLRCINALEPHQRGEVIVDGIPLTRDVRR